MKTIKKNFEYTFNFLLFLKHKHDKELSSNVTLCFKNTNNLDFHMMRQYSLNMNEGSLIYEISIKNHFYQF